MRINYKGVLCLANSKYNQIINSNSKFMYNEFAFHKNKFILYKYSSYRYLDSSTKQNLTNKQIYYKFLNSNKYQQQSSLLSNNIELYTNLLSTYNKSSMKKPQQNIKQAEQSLISKILITKSNQLQNKQINMKQIFQFFVKIRRYKLFNVQTLNKIQKYIQNNWRNIGRWEKICGLLFLVQQGRYEIYQQNWEMLQKQLLDDKQNKQISIIQKIIFQYCKNINTNKIFQRQANNQQQFFESKIEKMIINKYPQWIKQYSYLKKIYKIKSIYLKQINPNVKEFENTLAYEKKVKTRSNLQLEVQALLKTLNYKVQRQKQIYGFSVDFIITKDLQHQENSLTKQIQKNKIQNQCILQVMGAHHYTIDNKLFGKDILRLKILNNYLSVVVINSQQLNPIKGLQNRLNFLEQKIKIYLK